MGRQNENHNHRKLSNLITWTTALSNSMKLWAMPCRGTQDKWAMVESSDKTWSTGEGNGNHFSILALKPYEEHEKAKRYDTERWTPQIGRCPICYWTNLLGKSKKTAPKTIKRLSQSDDNAQLWMCLVVKVKVWCKEQYCIGTWNVRSMNQGKLEVVKQNMARVNINILWISELKWTGMSKFNSDNYYVYYCAQESLRRNELTLIINKKSPKCSSWMQSQKQQNDLSSFPMQTIQHHSNPSLSQPLMLKKWKPNGSMRIYKTF